MAGMSLYGAGRCKTIFSGFLACSSATAAISPALLPPFPPTIRRSSQILHKPPGLRWTYLCTARHGRRGCVRRRRWAIHYVLLGAPFRSSRRFPSQKHSRLLLLFRVANRASIIRRREALLEQNLASVFVLLYEHIRQLLSISQHGKRNIPAPNGRIGRTNQYSCCCCDFDFPWELRSISACKSSQSVQRPLHFGDG